MVILSIRRVAVAKIVTKILAFFRFRKKFSISQICKNEIFFLWIIEHLYSKFFDFFYFCSKMIWFLTNSIKDWDNWHVGLMQNKIIEFWSKMCKKLFKFKKKKKILFNFFQSFDNFSKIFFAVSFFSTQDLSRANGSSEKRAWAWR